VQSRRNARFILWDKLPQKCLGLSHYKFKQQSQAASTGTGNFLSQNEINSRSFESSTQTTKEMFKLFHKLGTDT
jgi:hypothetical protein